MRKNISLIAYVLKKWIIKTNWVDFIQSTWILLYYYYMNISKKTKNTDQIKEIKNKRCIIQNELNKSH